MMWHFDAMGCFSIDYFAIRMFIRNVHTIDMLLAIAILLAALIISLLRSFGNS
jgi:hypothetical protein